MNLRIEMIKTELILLCAPVLWGLGFSAAKSALSEVSPGWMNVFRAGIAVLVLLPFVIKYRD
ncbi:MAG: EamA family transporter [Eubacterium sp.]|nr:EamA family transporter [Eubacterium sp.]